jgi:hypothetical protein
MAELRKLTASLLTPTTRSMTARRRSTTTIVVKYPIAIGSKKEPCGVTWD